MMKCSPKDLEEQLKEAFKVFDKDGSGTISCEEIRQVSGQLFQITCIAYSRFVILGKGIKKTGK